MYLRSIQLKNTGPIKEFEVALPFDGENPMPVVFVGRNGSGKSTVISFIVNALLALKQQVYEDSEIERGRVFRIRSPLGIHENQSFYFAKLNFEKGVSLIEWQLNTMKQDCVTSVELANIDASWERMPERESSFFEMPMGELGQTHLLEKVLQENCFLFFPADRFEPPDWMNVSDLSTELRLIDPIKTKGKTDRRILSKNRLKITLDWLFSIIFDMMVSEHSPARIPINNDGGIIDARVPTPGKSHAVFNAISEILKRVLCQQETDTLQFNIGDRKNRIIGVNVFREEKIIRSIKDLSSLSAGESALFCMFASIIRDADLSSINFNQTHEISGIVVIDEADLHLHLGLQYEAFPKLMSLFAKIQFIFSVHAPMVALGLENVIGSDKFEIREMPDGGLITPETYSEFLTAFDLFTTTKKYQKEVLIKVNETALPALLVEGKTDAFIIQTAWEKLNPGIPIPFEAIPCGIEPNPEDRNGGAEQLRRCFEFLSIVTDRPIISVFDNDRIGNEQFKGISAKAFENGIDLLHRRHKSKPMHAILLPIPKGREIFASAQNIINRYLSIEHYFHDQLLVQHGLKGVPVIADSVVFEIEGSSQTKVHFSTAIKSLGPEQFKNFSTLFDRIVEIKTLFGK